MAVICPTVTPLSTAEFKQQMERLEEFITRVHLDFMDGDFAPTKSPPIEQAWWPIGVECDLHVMYRKPLEELETIISLQPSLVVIHAEADKVEEFLTEISGLGIKKGLALLHDSTVERIKPYLAQLDHVLIFSGDLGHFGGTADLTLLEKVKALKEIKPSLEIGWDGGINAENVAKLAAGGVDVLNVGGYIQRAADPEIAYDTLKQALA
jgi:ribulose-phosphate 3-epimerase